MKERKMIMRTQMDRQENAAAMMEDLEGRTLYAMTPSIPIPPPDSKVIAISCPSDPTKILIGLNQPVQPAPSGIIAILIG
jgi:hypothetical protein